MEAERRDSKRKRIGLFREDRGGFRLLMSKGGNRRGLVIKQTKQMDRDEKVLAEE